MFNLYACCLENPLSFNSLEEAKEKAKEMFDYEGKWKFNSKGQMWKAIGEFGLVILFEN